MTIATGSFLGRTALVALGAAVVLAGCALDVPESAAPPADPLTQAEKSGLRALHRKAVEIFVDRPGFGARRLRLPLEDVVTAPSSLYDADAPDRAAPEVGKAAKPAKSSHFAVQDLLTGGQAGNIAAADTGEVWKVRTVQLVGLMSHRQPVAYLTDWVVDARDVPTRELDAFEKSALEALRGGEAVRAEKRGRELRALGPIYAGQRCAACHDKGQLLGAFSYRLERGPAEPSKAPARNDPRTP
jgi:hypothetical protein